MFYTFDVAGKDDKMTLAGTNIYFDAIPWDLFWCHSLRFFYNLFVLFIIMIDCASEHSHLIKVSKM